MSGPSSGDWVRIVGIICLAIMAAFVASVSVKLDTVAASCECEDCRCCDSRPGKQPEQQEGR